MKMDFRKLYNIKFKAPNLYIPSLRADINPFIVIVAIQNYLLELKFELCYMKLNRTLKVETPQGVKTLLNG